MAKLLSDLNNVSRQNISAAGPRYSPGVSPGSPNLVIESLSSAIEALGQTAVYKDTLAKLARNIVNAWDEAPDSLKNLFKNQKATPQIAAKLLAALYKQAPVSSKRTFGDIAKVTQTTSDILQKRYNELWTIESEKSLESKDKEAIRTERYRLTRFQDAIAPLLTFLNSPNFRLIHSNRMFIRGEWGTGKTHFLCDVTRLRLSRGLPTLFVLAHRLPAGGDILTAIRSSTKITCSNNDFLLRLNQLGIRSKARALIIIDGINEADRSIWRKCLNDLAQKVAKFSNIGLVISCRSPFEQQIFTSATRKLFVEVAHLGFQEIEFDAQLEFFRFYDIPNPHVPLLAPEFSRPLFLKILCTTFSQLSARSKTRRIHDFAAGQKGMTKLFEDFINHVGTAIEKDFNLSRKTCWRILKGDYVRGQLVGVAVTMAARLSDSLSLEECIRVVKWVTDKSLPEARKIIRRMVADGLLVEDTIFQNNSWNNILRLSFQRFSDHLICRHLLDNYLDSSSERAIRRSFYRNRPLGVVFELAAHSWTYKFPGLASALMLEFPERVKRAVSDADRELVFYLPRNRRHLRPLVNVFLEGLLWRDPRSFSNQTYHIVEILLSIKNLDAKFSTLETLVALGSRPGHPFSAERLVAHLAKLRLADRDLLWSEFLRTAPRESATYRLMDWVAGHAPKQMAADTAHTLILLCSTFLTTTHRGLRDKATRTLVILGEFQPRELFDATLQCFSFNDPYVRERMLAASYGVSMRRWAFATSAFATLLTKFANDLYNAMFAPNAPYATKHFLSRDYALGVIELGRLVDRKGLRRVLRIHLKPTFAGIDPVPAADTISDKDSNDANSALRMDFENYTIGRLVDGRGNYNFEHKEYRQVLRQIKWRILDLGYDTKKFEQVDREISEDSFYREQRDRAEKVDRYGKKYSWIAYFELCGMREDRGVPPSRWGDARISDCDIDPSFPPSAKEWRPSLKPIFNRRIKSDRTWAERGPKPDYANLIICAEIDDILGPWNLMQGYISEISSRDDREIFSFLRGFFVPPEIIPRLKLRLAAVEYPGNQAIPDPGSDYYTFAGEIPWSNKYARMNRTKTGRAKRDIVEALELTIPRKVRKRVDKLGPWEKLAFLPERANELGQDETNEAPQAKAATYIDVVVYDRVPGFKVELPAYHFAWESYHSMENQIGSVDFIAPAICQALDLRNRGNSLDLFDSTGRQASIFRTFGKWPNTTTHLLYLRKDLLRKYLESTGRRMALVIWGERSFKSEKLQAQRDELQTVWASHAHIHKKLVVGRLN